MLSLMWISSIQIFSIILIYQMGLLRQYSCFVLGASFYLSTSRKFNDYKHFRKPLWVYLKRLGFILAIGYALNLPRFSIFQISHLPYDTILRIFECNILQAIVYSSILALVILLILPKLKYLKYISLIIALVIFYGTSFVWALDPSNI